MKTQEWKWIDKADWPRGEWDNEPDKVQWEDESTGLPCLAVRVVEHGHWCGYVGVGPDHPLFEKEYGDANVDCHGGLTFSEHCREESERCDGGICHKVEPGEPDNAWWFGFDCAHYCDYQPGKSAYYTKLGLDPWRFADPDSRYRSLSYVKDNCRDLARQLKEIQCQPTS